MKPAATERVAFLAEEKKGANGGKVSRTEAENSLRKGAFGKTR
jgi:hypothetical protein